MEPTRLWSTYPEPVAITVSADDSVDLSLDVVPEPLVTMLRNAVAVFDDDAELVDDDGVLVTRKDPPRSPVAAFAKDVHKQTDKTKIDTLFILILPS